MVDVSCIVAAVLESGNQLSTTTTETLEKITEAFLNGCASVRSLVSLCVSVPASNDSMMSDADNALMCQGLHARH